MEYTKLGHTGLDVSRICLGCMSYGGGNRGNHAWSLGEEESRPFIQRALEAGINFFDTANRYSLGNSEQILGRAIKDFARRDEVVIATKVYGWMRPGPNGAGLSRKAIFAEIDASLARLGMDYVDLYQIHRFDHGTPIEETLEALHDIVKAGKARYIGASSIHWRRFAASTPCLTSNARSTARAPSGSAGTERAPGRRSGTMAARAAAQTVARQRSRQGHGLHGQALAAFTRFLDDGRICLSNNAAERALRGIALGRKSWLFAGSDRGGQRAAAMYSLIVTAKLNNIDPQAWLADILARIADHPAHSIDQLLPWNWQPRSAPQSQAA